MKKMIDEQVLMRIFIGEGDRYEHKPLYEALLELLRNDGLAGATVLRGVCGFGTGRVCHTQRLLDLSANLPLVVEVVDIQEKIDLVLPKIDAMMGSGLITQEKVTIIRYSSAG